jgi:Uma2 family endonuclease
MLMADRNALVTEIAQLFPAQGRWTEQDYFSLPDAMRIVELAGGELVMPPPPSTGHQRAVGRLYLAVERHAATHDLGEALLAPLAVRLEENLIREPDVLFVSKAHAARVMPRGVEGPPDWVAEVTSPGTRATDEGVKLVEYERAGVGEYWLLDPEARTIRVYSLHEGSYGEAEQFAVGERAVSSVIESFSVAVEDVL